MAVNKLDIDLVPRFKKLKIKARRDVLNKALEGNWTTIFKGQGMEFAGYRAYTYSDDSSKIDWAASLRAHEILVRDLEEFHSFNVFFLVDVSDSMLFSSTDKLKAEYAAELVYSLCHSIIQGGDALGMGMFTDKLVAKISPSLGKDVFYRIIKTLSDSENYGGGFDFSKVLKYVRGFLKEKSLIIILSDFIGLKPGWEKYINILAGKYDVIGMMIRDPRDFELPKHTGQYLVEDPFTKEKLYIDANQYAKIYADENKRSAEVIENTFKNARLGFVSLRTDKEFHEPLMRYFRRRLAAVK